MVFDGEVINVVMAQQGSIKIIDGCVFQNISKTLCVKIVRCILSVVDHLKMHFQRDLVRTHHIHLIHSGNILTEITMQRLEKKLLASGAYTYGASVNWYQKINFTFVNAFIEYTTWATKTWFCQITMETSWNLLLTH